ncbi:hypothetical protein [Aliivibrio fischeri]|uniref:hypothetical protein n=1 Tax=Aliivibrio fischeri TaxID=668 RepID=UPI0007C5577F|nr:hypothetical protein [Aliivibrio fischeri]
MINLYKFILVFPILLLISGCYDDYIPPKDVGKVQPKDTVKVQPKDIAVIPDISYAHTSVSVILSEQPQIAKSTKSIDRYGVQTPIDFHINKDESIDVFWEDSGDKQSRWNLTKHNSYLDPTIIDTIIIPSSINQSGKFLGFDKKESNNSYFLAYSKDNTFAVRDNNGACVRVNRSYDNCDGAYWLSSFDDKGIELFNTNIFGDVDLTIKDVSGAMTKGNPGAASIGTVLYHDNSDRVILYTGHKQRFTDNIRHQAGWIGSFNSNGSIHKVINGWYSSHNFDQRLHLSLTPNSIYSLAHGDAYPRSLALGKWDVINSKRIFNYNYYDIKNGKFGDNTTLSDTGDIAVIDNERVVIAYATEDSRKSRDVVLKIISGVNGLNNKSIKEELNIWLTSYDESRMAGKGIKVAFSKNKIIVMWNEYHGSKSDISHKKGDYLSTIIEAYSVKGKKLGSMKLNDRLMPTQSIKITPDEKHVLWVTTSNNSELVFHNIDLGLI